MIVMERGIWKPNVEISPNCPRCGCSNTKFCYYNNYSLTQPRYFCKGCRRYWTKGGSLRNVPVGGGCRKNRRGKSLRLLTAADGVVVHSKSLNYGSTVSGGPVGHSYGGSLLDHEYSNRSSMLPDGSHIDLALVYANYLNPKPDNSKSTMNSSSNNNNGSEIPELGCDHFDPSLEFSSTPMSNLTIRSSIQLAQENGLVGCHISTSTSLPQLSTENCCSTIGNEQIYNFCGLDSFHKQYQDRTDHCVSDFGLPPLPGQEVLWSSSSHQMMISHAIQATQLPVLGPEAHQDENLLTGNWSPFDLPSEDTFSGQEKV